MTPFEERRFAIIEVDSRYIIDLLNFASDPADCLQIPIPVELPKDAVVVSVNACWEKRTIQLMVASRKYEPLQMGLVPPIVNRSFEYRTISMAQMVERYMEKRNAI